MLKTRLIFVPILIGTHQLLDDSAVEQSDFPHEIGFRLRVDSLSSCPVTLSNMLK